jgi:hypothetical protein
MINLKKSPPPPLFFWAVSVLAACNMFGGSLHNMVYIDSTEHSSFTSTWQLALDMEFKLLASEEDIVGSKAGCSTVLM